MVNAIVLGSSNLQTEHAKIIFPFNFLSQHIRLDSLLQMMLSEIETKAEYQSENWR